MKEKSIKVKKRPSALYKKLNEAASGELFRAFAKQLGVFLLALVLTRTEFTASLCPFPLALIIGVSDSYVVAGTLGLIVGGWTGTMGSYSFVAAAGVVAALRWILAGMSHKKNRRGSYLPSLIAAGITVAAVEISAAVAAGALTLRLLAVTFASFAISGAFSYFYRVTFDALRRRSTILEYSGAQKACAALAACSVLMSLVTVSLGPFSLGRIVCAALALFCAQLFAPPFDIVVFGAIAAAVALSEPTFGFAAAGLCAAGAVASLFKKKGKPLLCAVFVLCAASFCFCAGSYIPALCYVCETLFGAMLFLALPLKSAADARFSYVNNSLASAASTLSSKLDAMTSSLRSITGVLDATVELKNARCDTDKLYRKSAEKVCRKCALMSYCWVKHFDETTDALTKATPALIKNSSLRREDLNELFRSRCMSVPALVGEINKNYTAYLEHLTNIKNTQLYKSMLKKQFSAVCDMLDSARGELCAFSRWDEQRSHRVFDAAARLGLAVENAGCVSDALGRPIVTVTLAEMPSPTLLRRLTLAVSSVCSRAMTKPTVSSVSGSSVLSFTQQQTYTVRTAVSQLCAERGVCGDVYRILRDLRGNVHIVMSDGMGTGTSARRDGGICCAFLEKLLENGFAVKRAAELANSALALREDSESASTLDVLSIEVYTGVASLFKAGAAPTYILRGSAVKRVDGRTLPVGILDTVVSREIPIELADGDVVVMASDGLEDAAHPFIEQTLKLLYDASADDICAELIARAKSNLNATDDVTVAVARIKKSNESA